VQIRLAEAIAATGKPTVVVLKNGRALELSGAVLASPAILVSWFLGKKTGSALAGILFGDAGPSGRLPVSFPIRSGQQPYFYNHMSSGRPCKGARFQNCWSDLSELSNRALFPFGHGLTYTEFAYGAPRFGRYAYDGVEGGGGGEGGRNEATVHAHGVLSWDGALNITTTLTNVGAREGEEVVQLYIHDRVASRVRPVRELKGFAKVRLAPGMSQEVTFTLNRHDLSFTAADPHMGNDVNSNKTISEPGMFDLWVASSAANGDSSAFELLGPNGH
jgi:beta-glucosidase